VGSGGPVHLASARAGACLTQIPKYWEIRPISRPLRRSRSPARHRSRTASGSNRRRDSAASRTGVSPPGPACRRSGTASPCARLASFQPPAALSQPKRIGKPSPPSSVMDS